MIRQFIRLVFNRNFKKNRFHTWLNVIGLSIGFMVFIFIMLFVRQQRSYDTFHTNYEELYRIIMDSKRDKYAGSPAQLGPYLLERIPEIEGFVRLEEAGDVVVMKHQTRFYESNLLYADSSFFELFSFSILKGDQKAPLTHPDDIVLSQKTARKYFGDENPVGKTIQLFEDQKEFTVAAVAENPPVNSSVQYSMLIPFVHMEKVSSWGMNNYTTFLKLSDKRLDELVEQKMRSIVVDRDNEQLKLDYLSLQAMEKMHFEPIRGNSFQTIDEKYIFMGISAAIFLLLLAVINYSNLATAISIKRSREVALKKISGSSKTRIVFEIVGESILLALFSFLIALVWVELLKQVINHPMIQNVQMNYSYLPALVLISVFVGFLAGIYPAVYSSGFSIMSLLKESVYKGKRAGAFRNVLVLIQFGITSFLLICAFTYSKQLNYVTASDLGMNPSNVYTLPVHWPGVKVDELKEALLNDPGIEKVATSTYQTGQDNWNQSAFWKGMNEDEQFNMFVYAVDKDFFETMGVELIEGKDRYADLQRRDRKLYVLNESAKNRIGWKEAEGKPFSIFNARLNGRVVGVSPDVNMRSLHHKIGPSAYIIYDAALPYNMYIRVADAHVEKVRSVLQEKWKEFAPENAPFMLSSMDQDLINMYQTEMTSKRVVVYFTLVAMIISFLGLLGLTTYISLQRTKEIGIRKVLGSTEGGIVRMFGGQFLAWVLIAFLLASPLAYLYMRQWLQNFAYKTEVGADVFLLAGLFALMVGFLSVVFQSVRAAKNNPVDSLRYE